MRLGRHIACPTGESRDGVLKSVSNPTKNKFTASPHTIDFQDMAKYVDNKNFMIRLKVIEFRILCTRQTALQNFVRSMEESLAQLLIEDERLFDRAYFRELLALDWRAKRNASAALAANAEKKYYESQFICSNVFLSFPKFQEKTRSQKKWEPPLISLQRLCSHR